MITVIRSVRDLPKNGKFYIYGDDEYSYYTSVLIDRFGYVFLGFIENEQDIGRIKDSYLKNIMGTE